jgi:hypothetical protein
LSGNPHLRIVPLEEGEHAELETRTSLSRRFFCIEEGEAIELNTITDGGIFVGHATSEKDQVRLLRDAHNARGYRGCYQLVNGPMDPKLTYRYELNTWNNAKQGRATDSDIQSLRAVYIDIDPIRPKNISSTDAELQAAWDVSDAAIAHGCSGNGYFELVAIQPVAPTKETAVRIAEFLKLLDRKFRTDLVKIDTTTFNAARLMPAPGTMKRKGRNSLERPHRMVSFSCKPDVRRVPLEALC